MTTWLEHVKKVHASGSTSFKESLKRASKSWKSGSKAPKRKGSKRTKGKKKEEAEPEEEPVSTEAPAAPKKKRRRRLKPKVGPKIPSGKAYKRVDSVNL